MNIDNIRDADDAFAYLEKLATDAKRVSAKLAEFSRQKTTYNPHGDRFLTPNGVATVAIDAATASKCHRLANASQDFYKSIFESAQGF
jgi:hypothetical protein